MTGLGPNARLNEQLRDLADHLSPTELDHFRLILCLAAGALQDGHAEAPSAAFETVIDVLDDDSKSSILYQGFPSFIDASLIDALVAEAQERRPTAARNPRYALAYGGTIGDSLASSPALAALLGKAVEGRKPAGARYLYYENDDDGADPHVDNKYYDVSTVLMLRHEGPVKDSCLLLHHSGRPATRIPLTPGELVAFHAGRVVHSRERMKPGERITLLTMGFL